MKISIADRNSDADALARLFAESLTPAYISHSELQGPRALAPGQWAPDIDTTLRREITDRLREPLSEFPKGKNWRGVAQAHEGGTLVGLAYLTIVADAPRPYGIIDDIVIVNTRRGAGLGEEFMRWILDSFAKAGIRRTFLESGINNKGAHQLFERLGFSMTSIVMIRDA